MALMRALYRTIAAISVALPLAVAGSSIANAGTDNGKPPKPHHKHHKHHKGFKIDVDQDLNQLADQENSIKGKTIVLGKNNNVNTQSNSATQSGTQDAFSK